MSYPRIHLCIQTGQRDRPLTSASVGVQRQVMRVGLVSVFLDIYLRICLYLCLSHFVLVGLSRCFTVPYPCKDIYVYIRVFTSSSVLCLQVQPSARSAGPQVEGFDAYAYPQIL
jgi:hypothetical protein